MGAEIFQKVKTERTSTQIVEQIKQAIREGPLKIGDRLPSGRDMAEQLSVSRFAVRDALRILEARGLVAIRVGPHGGAFVTAPLSSIVSEGLTDMLTLSNLTSEEVTEARRALAVGAVPLVCERATDEDFAELERLCDEGDQGVAAGEYDVLLSAEFHMRLVQATHNKTVMMLMQVLQDSMLASLRRAREAAPQMGVRGVRERRKIVETMKMGDAATASSIMTSHLNRTASRVIEANEAVIGSGDGPAPDDASAGGS